MTEGKEQRLSDLEVPWCPGPASRVIGMGLCPGDGQSARCLGVTGGTLCRRAGVCGGQPLSPGLRSPQAAVLLARKGCPSVLLLALRLYPCLPRPRLSREAVLGGSGARRAPAPPASSGGEEVRWPTTTLAQ